MAITGRDTSEPCSCEWLSVGHRVACLHNSIAQWMKMSALTSATRTPFPTPIDVPCTCRCKTLFANMPVYLDYLRQQLDQLGVHIAQRHVNRLSDLQRSGEQICVVNCCGLSAQNLVDVHDDTLYPIRGQIELVKHDSDEFVTLREGEHPISILPRGDGTAVLNGTYDADNYDLNPDATVSKAIRERCAMLDPRVQHAPNITSHVALRPARRGGVRLEAEHTDQGMVVHNYGHGGRGLVLSYGCANEVLNTLRAAWNVLN
eukprot:TRINITY_DN10328_c0_g1_i4.p1 TRINITY_DN10328_c0_g1~~TRINITY_DN10328_c0_g1_i4.p1  ORF type:complete len:260 (+),score=9.40 TRINITY_DN10328_c0_g1_i4:158-937(+)